VRAGAGGAAVAGRGAPAAPRSLRCRGVLLSEKLAWGATRTPSHGVLAYASYRMGLVARAQAQAVELSLAEAHRQRGAEGQPAPPPRPHSASVAALVPASVLGMSSECAAPHGWALW